MEWTQWIAILLFALTLFNSSYVLGQEEKATIIDRKQIKGKRELHKILIEVGLAAMEDEDTEKLQKYTKPSPEPASEIKVKKGSKKHMKEKNPEEIYKKEFPFEIADIGCYQHFTLLYPVNSSDGPECVVTKLQAEVDGYRYIAFHKKKGKKELTVEKIRTDLQGQRYFDEDPYLRIYWINLLKASFGFSDTTAKTQADICKALWQKQELGSFATGKQCYISLLPKETGPKSTKIENMLESIRYYHMTTICEPHPKWKKTRNYTQITATQLVNQRNEAKPSDHGTEAEPSDHGTEAKPSDHETEQQYICVYWSKNKYVKAELVKFHFQ